VGRLQSISVRADAVTHGAFELELINVQCADVASWATSWAHRNHALL